MLLIIIVVAIIVVILIVASENDVNNSGWKNGTYNKNTIGETQLYKYVVSKLGENTYAKKGLITRITVTGLEVEVQYFKPEDINKREILWARFRDFDPNLEGLNPFQRKQLISALLYDHFDYQPKEAKIENYYDTYICNPTNDKNVYKTYLY